METAAPERRHLKTLERRIAHLEARVEQRKEHEGEVRGSATYEASELAALKVALKVMQLYRDEAVQDAYTTSFLLEEAAQAVEQTGEGGHVLGGADLVEELRERAVLLDELTK